MHSFQIYMFPCCFVQVLVNTLLQKILTSRRLLADHVETLELSSINVKSDGAHRQLFRVAPTVGLLGITIGSAQYLDAKYAYILATFIHF